MILSLRNGLTAIALLCSIGAFLLAKPATAATNTLNSVGDTNSAYLPPYTYWLCEIDGKVHTTAAGSVVQKVQYNVDGLPANTWDGQASVISCGVGCACSGWDWTYTGQNNTRYVVGSGPIDVWTHATIMLNGGTLAYADSNTLQWSP